jgi:hypothetical protein
MPVSEGPPSSGMAGSQCVMDWVQEAGQDPNAALLWDPQETETEPLPTPSPLPSPPPEAFPWRGPSPAAPINAPPRTEDRGLYDLIGMEGKAL